MDKYGVDSIKQIDGAFCYAWPVLTFSDFYKYYRRSKIELVKIHTWFPEYNYLLKYQNRRTDWGKWWQSNLKSKTIWIIFLSIKFLLFVYLQLEIILLRFSWYKPKKQWQTVVSTKLKS
jgi:hypothetical protein